MLSIPHSAARHRFHSVSVTLLLLAFLAEAHGALPTVEEAGKLLQMDVPAPLQFKVQQVMAPPNSRNGEYRVQVTYQYQDAKDQVIEGNAKIYLPASVTRTSKVPLYYAAGYELDDNSALGYVRRGWAVVSTGVLPGGNPLSRTPRPDTALLHRARALPFIQDTKVWTGGGSAGGYMTLMVAAETFPLAAAMPDAPPVNWGYNGAYFFKQKDLVKNFNKDGQPRLPLLASVIPALENSNDLIGRNFDDKSWFALSPVGNLDGITAPVSVYWTTADVLVPVDQLGKDYIRPLKAEEFPAGFTMDVEKLMTSREGRTRLLEALDPKLREVSFVPPPAGSVKLDGNQKPADAKSTPLTRTSKQWSIVIVDEGSPEPWVGHFKYFFGPNREHFVRTISSEEISVDQLTEAKLIRLMNRYAGVENPDCKLKQLDFPAAEKADVLRGLKTFTQISERHRTHFDTLYQKLPAAQKVLPEGALK